jgi:peptidoglycan-N-acetylglucosamine deacetylase
VRTSTSSSAGIIARSSVGRQRGSAIAIAGFIVLLAGLYGLHRWINHARAELIPVIVPQAYASRDVLDPPAGAIANRMALDIRDLLSPPVRPRLAVLTFDDGPYPVTTPALLAQLRRLNVPADFFLIGNDSRQQPAIAARIASGGNEIGNHTLSHPQLPALGFEAQLEEIVDGAQAIERATKERSAYFRPPHGNFTSVTIDAARSAHETVALWDVDPGDWRRVTPQFITQHVLAHAKSPMVVLLHNGSQATIDTLPQIVQSYRRAGFDFVTLSELARRLRIEEINDPVTVGL